MTATGDDDRRWVGSMPEVYDRLLGPVLFEPYAADLARRVAASAPSRVLELAAGTGIVTAELVALLPDAALTATDLNDSMVERGAAKVPGATWRQADALDLSVEDSSFDVVVCQFGVMFFPDRPRAFSEAARALVADGRLVFNVWTSVDGNDAAAAVQDALVERFPDDPPAFLPGIPYGYHDRSLLSADLAAAGLRIDSWEVVSLAVPALPRDLAMGFLLGTPVRAELAARTSDPDGVAEELAGVVAGRLGAAPTPTKLSAVVVEARPLQ